MKCRNTILPFALTLLSAVSYSQTQTPKPEDSQPTADTPAIAVARCAYAPNDDACAAVTNSNQNAGDGSNGTVVAQFPRRMSRPPMRRPMGYPPPYPNRWAGEWNGRGAAIGALIGGGLGVALGIRVNTDNHARAQIAAPLLIGGLGALVGAVAGGNWPAGPHWRHRRSWPDDDEDACGSKPAAADSTTKAASATPPSPKPSSANQDFPEPDTPASSIVAHDAVPAAAGR